MKNERNVSIQEEGQEPKRRYRLNKRKFTITLALLCFAVAAIVIATHYINSADDREAIAALNPPQSTAGNGAATHNNQMPLEGKTIVVDAGHGGDDQGATGVNGSVERELNLSVATLLKQQFESKGARVVMTRTDDTLAETKDEDWEKRGEIITQSDADAVISIHMNWFEDSSVSGPLVLSLTGSEQGRKLAGIIQSSMNEMLEPERQGRSRSEDLHILKYGFQPSALVECGYISNAREEEMLNTEEYQLKVAKAVCDGVVEYFINN